MVGNMKGLALGCLAIAAILYQCLSTKAEERSSWPEAECQPSHAECQSPSQHPSTRECNKRLSPSDVVDHILCDEPLPPRAIMELEKRAKESQPLDAVNFNSAMLIGVNLQGISFKGAALSHAHLEGANLGWRNTHSSCPKEEKQCDDAPHPPPNMCDVRSNLSGANLSHAHLENADLKYANLRNADLTGAYLMDADLTGADLECAKLCKASLNRAHLNCANLQNANFREAKLDYAEFRHANLTKSDFHNASLVNTYFNYAYLERTDFSAADLEKADLTFAQLIATFLQDSRVTGTILTNAQYEPVTTPSEAYLTDLYGLKTVRFDNGKQAGLVLLRAELEKLGLRDLEREANYAIQRGIDKQGIEVGKQAGRALWHAVWEMLRAEFLEGPATFGGFAPSSASHRQDADLAGSNSISLLESLYESLEGVGYFLRRIAFDCTTHYGLYPDLALFILVGSLALFALIYLIVIWPIWPISTRSLHAAYGTRRHRGQSKISGIYIITDDRIDMKEGRPQINKEAVIARVQHRGWKAIRFAAYVSVLFAFNIGFREITVGNWIARLQTHEYTLRAEGWVRVIAGLQSLLSLYMLVMWVLTYFGRPFQ